MTASKWIAFVAKHTNIQMYLSLFYGIRDQAKISKIIVPALLMAKFENGREIVTLGFC